MTLTKTDILNILPHRNDILLLDSAVPAPDGCSIRAEWYLHPEWQVFKDHFPGYPVLPGIYITESMAQAAALLLLEKREHRGKLPLFLGISQMRFLRPALPGNSIQLCASVLTNAAPDLYEFRVSASVNGEKIAAGKLSLALKPCPK